MRTLKAGTEANQINELHMNIFNSLAKCSQFVLLTQEATFRLPFQQNLYIQITFTYVMLEV